MAVRPRVLLGGLVLLALSPALATLDAMGATAETTAADGTAPMGPPPPATHAGTHDEPASAPESQGPAEGGIGVRLVDAGPEHRNDPRAGMYIIERPSRSATVRRRVEVTNTSPTVVTVVVYAAAAQLTGAAFSWAEAHGANELTAWTSVTPRHLVLPPGGNAGVTVTIVVPDDGQTGDHYEVIWAEARAEQPDGGGFTQVNRVGVRVYLSVNGDGPRAAAFTIRSITAHRTPDGRPGITATVTNTGGRELELDGTLTLADGPGGVRAGPLAIAPQLPLAAGDTRDVTVPLDPELAIGPWNAQVRLYTRNLTHTRTATLIFPESVISAADRPAAGPGPARHNTHGIRNLVLGGLAAVFGIASTGTLIAGRRRLQPCRPLKPD
jgi:hypothetical protein